MSTYRFCDNVWTLVLKDFSVKDSNTGQHNTAIATAPVPRVDKVKIVACDGKSMELYFLAMIITNNLVAFFFF